MPIVSLLNSLRDEVRSFGNAERGNVMIMFALLIVPLIGFVGAAI